MKLKSIFLSSLFASCVLFGSCNSGLRLLKDVYVVAICPVLIPMAASGDASRGATDIREGYQSGAWTEVVAYPVLALWHGVKHTCMVAVHVLDIVAYPGYLISEASALGPDIKLLDYYGNTWVDGLYESHNSKVDANTGETGK